MVRRSVVPPMAQTDTARPEGPRAAGKRSKAAQVVPPGASAACRATDVVDPRPLLAFTGEELRRLRFVACGSDVVQAARWLGVHRRTLDRQEGGFSRVQGPVIRAFQLKAGDLGLIHADWDGWRLAADGKLYGRELVRGFEPADLYLFHIRNQQWRECRRHEKGYCVFCRVTQRYRKWRSKRFRK